MNAVDIDTSILEILDWDFAPPCEKSGVDCDHVAEWKVVMSCCGKVVLFCDPHMQEKLDMISRGVLFQHYTVGDNIGCGAATYNHPYSLIEKF